jgi:hypothetical protein
MRSLRSGGISIPELAKAARDRATREPAESIVDPVLAPSHGFLRMEFLGIDFMGDVAFLSLAADANAAGDRLPDVEAASINGTALVDLRSEVERGSSQTGLPQYRLRLSGRSPELGQMAMKLRDAPLVIRGRLADRREFGAYRTTEASSP